MSITQSSRRVMPLVAAALPMVLGSTAGAQTAMPPETPGYFLGKPAVALASARRGCLELGDRTYADDVHQIGPCVSLGFRSLGVIGGSRWYSSLAHRRWLLGDPARNAADTSAESELVLFSGDTTHTRTRDTLVTAVWHFRFEPEMLRSVSPEIAAVDGGVLIAIDACVNGTGGCSQSFLLRRDGKWSNVRLFFLDSLTHRFPDAINHGYHVDLRTMRGDAAVYSPGDANCCPSRSAEMRLRLRGDALEIVELRVRPIR
jgi:hypothetical protein